MNARRAGRTKAPCRARRARLAAAFLAGVALAVAGGCGGGAGGGGARPDILLVTIDTLRADHLGTYGYARSTSPRIDRLAAEGALFEVAYAPMGTTSPSHAALFTSRSPQATRLVRNGLLLASAEVTLAELLAKRGYRTAAFVSSYPVSARLGFAQGFGHFDDEFEPSPSEIVRPTWEGHEIEGVFSRPGDQTVDHALRWLRAQDHGAPTFVWLHLFDPHFPYFPPPAHRDLFRQPGRDEHGREIDLYDGEVHHADYQFGRFLDAFTAFAEEPPLVVLTADHGEGLWDHGWRAHNRHLFEEEVRVPLIFHWPGHVPAGRRVTHPARLVDILPSLLGVLRPQAALRGLDGADLFPYLRGETAADPARAIWLMRPLYPEGEAAADRAGPCFGLRTGPWKYIEAPEQEQRLLFHLGRDPGERTNLADEEPARAAAMAARITEWRARERAKVLAGDLSTTQEDERALRALGYGGDR